MDEKLRATADRLGVPFEHMPRHIAIIMDGNGRWAQRQGLPRYEGHRQGAETTEKVAQCCVDLGIHSLTLYSFSTENWKRPLTEVNGLMGLYAKYLEDIRPSLMRNNVRLVHLGRTAGLPEKVCDALARTKEMTAPNTGMILALALNYSGRAEIVDAARAIAECYRKGEITADQIDEKCVSDHLYTAGMADPDLLIRTADELRVSNFLLWQISYSEFYVTPTLWPSFDAASIDQAILAYAKRERRFGAIQTSQHAKA
jgi:undecaprenyl diphosphate synthase